jgi:hypothetical protein
MKATITKDFNPFVNVKKKLNHLTILTPEEAESVSTMREFIH